MILTTSVSPAAKLPEAATGKTHGGGKGHGARWASLFGATLASSAAATTTTTTSNVLAQLTSTLQNGTPITAIVDQIAQSVGSSVATLAKGRYAQSDVDRLRQTTTRTIANALSPPSNAPPGTAADSAAALAARLQEMVENIARGRPDTPNASGQQNEISGTILDAKPAKDTPARSERKPSTVTSGTPDVPRLVRSLLGSALAALRAAANTTSDLAAKTAAAVTATAKQSADTPPSPARTDAATSTHSTIPIATRALSSAALAAAPSLADALPSLAPTTASSPASAAPAQTSTPSQPSTSPQQQTAPANSAITMSNAPDVLARMLVRAAGVDAQLAQFSASATSTASDDVASAGTAASAAMPSGSLGLLTPATLAARFAALITDASLATVTSPSSSGNTSTNTSTNTNSGHAFDQSTPQQTPSGLAALLAAPAANTGSQAQSASQPTTTGATVDPSEIIEQMITGMTMRTLTQGTSEIHLQLQPENLGQVTMRLTVTGNQVTANVVAQNADVGNALVANHQDLARSLSAAGLSLSGFSVDVSGGDAGADQGKDRTSGFGRRYVVHELSGANATAETTEASNPGPSLLGGSSLELFNSLA